MSEDRPSENTTGLTMVPFSTKFMRRLDETEAARHKARKELFAEIDAHIRTCKTGLFPRQKQPTK